MLQNKSNKILSEIKDFFTSGEKGVLKTIDLFKILNLSNLNFGVKDFEQASYKKGEVFLILLLFPLFRVKNIRMAIDNRLTKYIDAQKDVYYRFKNNSFINWRKVLNTVNRRLFKNIEQHKESDSRQPKCLILDDTDLEKTGLRIEHIGKIWSHVLHRRVLGFKGLFLGYWDSKSLFAIDFSLHKEKGNNKKFPFGLKPAKIRKQFKKKRTRNSAGNKRVAELTAGKITNGIKLINRALKTKIEVDYILMDSWFVCDKMIKFVGKVNEKVNLIGMLKNGKAKYVFENKEFTAKQIADVLKKRKKVKKVRKLGMYVADTVLTYKGSEIKVFFCKTSKRGKWHLLVSTDVSLSIEKAYEIYSIRWSIEVFFKESKQYFGLGKCQARDFDAQIADNTIIMIQYNLLSIAKRFSSYETLGQLFRELQDNIAELTISERIWGFILELLKTVVDFFDSNFNDLIVNILKSNTKENKLINLLQSNFLKSV